MDQLFFMTEDKLELLVIEGTAREGRKSIRPALYVTRKLNSRGHDTELFDLADREIPMLEHTRYSDNDKHPEDIEEFGQKVEKADGLVVVSPEYNHSIPGSLKNLLDHLYPEYNDKPFSFVTVSGGSFGGVRALSHLHDVALEFGGNIGPDIPVSNVGSTFNEEGELEDDNYIDRFESFLDDVEEHTARYS
ncbi:hypothetical protein GKQ38_02185 [Candidatus Nanohaloarchaea archaeon]|nr:hypothetical protein GKQ38_02185 [Candidatus Nanohaloarchaea archaeon]